MKCYVQVLQNGSATAGYTVTAPAGSGSNASLRLDECQRGMLLNAVSATPDTLYRSEVALPAAATTVTPVVSAADDAQRHAVPLSRQVRLSALSMKYFKKFIYALETFGSVIKVYFLMLLLFSG